jgi:hypothetical protein
MIRTTKTWDIRCPDQLKRLLLPRKGYWFKVDRAKAQLICDILSATYGIQKVRVMPDKPSEGNYGEYRGDRGGSNGQIWLHGRAHVKSVFHEWYHHLDRCTKGTYDSNDHSGGPSSYGWQFGDRMFDALKVPIVETEMGKWARQGLPKGHPEKD